jgi:hypothetical protein
MKGMAYRDRAFSSRELPRLQAQYAAHLKNHRTRGSTHTTDMHWMTLFVYQITHSI